MAKKSSHSSLDPSGDLPDKSEFSAGNGQNALDSARDSHDIKMDELRRLLVGSEGRQIEGLQERLTALSRLEEEGQVDALGKKLPDAIAYHNEDRSKLINALSPALEETLSVSIRRNPQPFADAIFPAIGPAIRRSIAEALRSVIDSMNRMMEHSFSMQSLKWRIEAARTGQSFSEVMISHTLNYRVEQIFLIDRKSGILIQHLFAESVEVKDGDVMTSMLTAIQDFMRDSLGLPKEDLLETVEIGDTTVLIEPGPHAILAAVVQGIPTGELRTTLKEIIEAIHLQYGHVLKGFDGDTDELRPVLPLMRAGLLEKYKEKEKNKTRIWIVAGVILIGLLAWMVWSYRSYQLWNDYIDVLKNEPGLVVTQSSWERGQLVIEGLRDPLARAPESLLPSSLEADKMNGRWEPYLALDPQLIVKRAARQLQAPVSVSFRVENGVLKAEGNADNAWMINARDKAPYIPGIVSYDDSELNANSQESISRLIEQVESVDIVFAQGTAGVDASHHMELDQVAEWMTQILEQGEATERQIRMQIRGYSSTDGIASANQALSESRAQSVREAMVARGLPANIMIAVGTGEPRFPGIETTETERRANRSVTFVVTMQ